MRKYTQDFPCTRGMFTTVDGDRLVSSPSTSPLLAATLFWIFWNLEVNHNLPSILKQTIASSGLFGDVASTGRQSKWFVDFDNFDNSFLLLFLANEIVAPVTCLPSPTTRSGNLPFANMAAFWKCSCRKCSFCVHIILVWYISVHRN